MKFLLIDKFGRFFSRLLAGWRFFGALALPGLVSGVRGALRRAGLRARQPAHLGRTDLVTLALDNMNQGICVVCPDGRIWVYNKRALEYAGVTEKDFPFPPTARQVFAAQQSNGEFGPQGELIPAQVREFFLEGKGRPPKSYIRARPDGTILEIRSEPMPGGSVIQTYTDVTEVVRAKERAEAAARAKATFLAVMSHEIRTPLNGVIGSGALLRDTALTSEQKTYVDTIEACGEALLSVINDVLDFSKFEAVGVELDEAACRPVDLFASARLVMQAAAEAKGLSLEVDLCEDAPEAVVADEKRLRQVLINLVGNAVKFTRRGSVRLGLRLIQGVEGERLRVTVKDTGIGVAAKDHACLFKEFSQIGRSAARGGSGLGLAISRRIVEAMGGAIGVVSEEGAGSEFWFEIPCRRSAPPISRADGPELASQPSRRPAAILVAEDVPTNQLVATALLRRLGHRVVVVADGAAALARLQAESFDLALLDMQMPTMDGLAAARAIRACGGRLATIPLIATTANAFASDERRCLAAGMNGLMTKPLHIPRLADMIDRFLVASCASHPPPADEARLRRLFGAIGRAGTDEAIHVFQDESSALYDEILTSARRCDASALENACSSLRSALRCFAVEDAAALCKPALFLGQGRLDAVAALDRSIRLALRSARSAAAEGGCAAGLHERPSADAACAIEPL